MFTLCLFNFLVFWHLFFYILTVYGFQKNFKIFVLFYFMDPRFYQKLRYLKPKIWTKFYRLLFHFFVVFYWKGLRFYQRFLENSKSSFKKILIFEIIFFHNSAFYYLFFYFVYYFWHFIFNFIYLCLSKSSRNFYVFLFYGLEIFINEFWKIMEYFSKKCRHLKSKILHKF